MYVPYIHDFGQLNTDFDLKFILAIIGRWNYELLISFILSESGAICLIRPVITVIDIVTSCININASSIATGKLNF